MAPSDRIGVVILHWHTEDATMACLGSIVQAQNPGLKLYIIDNGSSTGFKERIHAICADAIILGNGTNRGFAAGANIGARQALEDGCTHVLFLNSDTVLALDASPVLCRGQFLIATPRILSENNRQRIWFDGGKIAFNGRGIHVDFGRNLSSLVMKPGSESMSFATACAMLVRCEALEKIGYLDEALFAYGEDLDFSIRAASAAITIGIERKSIIYHSESHSVKRNVGKDFRDYYVIRNAVLLLNKHFRRNLYWLRLLDLLVTAFLVPAIYFAVSFQMTRVRALIHGLQDGLRGIGGKSPRWE